MRGSPACSRKKMGMENTTYKDDIQYMKTSYQLSIQIVHEILTQKKTEVELRSAKDQR